MDNRGGDMIVIILIWGFLFYLLTNAFAGGTTATKPKTGPSNGNFLASIINSFSGAQKENTRAIEGIISVSEDGKNFETAAIHSRKEIDLLDIKKSPDSPKTFFAASNYGLFVSRDNGFNWKPFSDSKNKINSEIIVRKILFAPSSKYGFLSVSDKGRGMLYGSSDGFRSLEKIFEVENEIISGLSASENNIYFGISDGRLLNYSLKEGGLSALNDFGEGIVDLGVGGAGKTIYILLENGKLLASEDNGRSFEKRKDDVERFIVEPKIDVIVYASDGKGLYRSLNAGRAFKEIKILSAGEDLKIFAIAFDAQKRKIFVASEDKIYKSENEGLNWRILYPGISRRIVSIINAENDRIIAGTKKASWFSNH